jgi:hypothetical protein
MLNNIVTPDSGSTILFIIVDKCELSVNNVGSTTILFNPVKQRGLIIFTHVA